MDMSDKGKIEIEKRNGTNNIGYGSSSIPTDWQLGDVNPASTRGLFPTENAIAVCSSSSCSTAPMPDSFGQTLWHDRANIQNTEVSGFSSQNIASSSSTMGVRNINHASLRNSTDRPLDMMYNPPNLLPKSNGLFLPNVPVFLPQSLAEFPADSGFIERAARLSCFGGGNFSDMMNHPLGIPESIGLYSQSGRMMQGTEDVRAGIVSKLALGEQFPMNGINVSEPPKDPLLGVEHDGLKNDGKSTNLVRSNEEAKHYTSRASNVSDEAQSSGGNGQSEQLAEVNKGRETPSKGSNTRKRKRMGQDSEPDHSNGCQPSGEAAEDNADNKPTDEKNPNSAMNQTSTGKQGKQNSDPPKEGYIHVRARRGQATNSHSLAERVRREKISERMKFLQDLVPGCNKVTGKAVMLDEIINYVQSLQRQVEFLSMKLATVNPQLDFNIEGLLAKEVLHSRPGPSSFVPFPQDVSMAYPPLLHPSQPGLIQPVLSGMSNPSNFLQRTINSQFPLVSGEFKQERESHAWEGDLQNVIQMNCGTGTSIDNQDETESPPSGNMKVES